MILFCSTNDIRIDYQHIMEVLAVAVARPKEATCTVAERDVPPVTLRGARAVAQFEDAFVHGMAGHSAYDSWTLSLNGVLLAHLRRDGKAIELTLHDDLLHEGAVQAYK